MKVREQEVRDNRGEDDGERGGESFEDIVSIFHYCSHYQTPHSLCVNVCVCVCVCVCVWEGG